MQISIRIEGLDNLIAKLREFTTSADDMLTQTMLDSATEYIVAVAKSLAPKKTGALIASIEARAGEEPAQIFVVADKFYAPFLEYGTRYIPEGKFTFLGPAIEEGIASVRASIQEMFERELSR